MDELKQDTTDTKHVPAEAYRAAGLAEAPGSVEDLRASIGAIHFFAARPDCLRDFIGAKAVLLSIRDECERAVPVLSFLRPPNEKLT